MANFIEKRLPGPLRTHLRTMIAAALGLFLGLRYNDYLKAVLDKYIPMNGNLLWNGLILIGVTLLIVYISVRLEQALDGV